MEAALATVAVASTLLFFLPTLRTIAEETQRFRRLHLVEAGLSGAGALPPVSEDLVAAARRALRPGDTWTLALPEGTCEDRGSDGKVNYAFQWMAFRVFPNQPGCHSAAVILFWRVTPPEGSQVVSRGPDFTIVRR